MIKKVIRKIPFLKKIFNEIDKLEMELKSFKDIMAFPPGHFYSPIPSIEEIKEKEIFDKFPEEIPGINLNKKRQFELLTQFESYYKDQPFQAKKSKE